MTLYGYDRVGTVRTLDNDGRLHVAKTPISKANICQYLGREIPNSSALGLESEKLYRLFRDPDELRKAAPTFNRMPLLSEHENVSADNPRPDLVVGSTGEQAEFTAPYLTNSLVIWDGAAIERIQSGEQRELSCAYAYVPVMKPGQWQGQNYDGVMTEIRGSHLALVPKGRAGPDVLVADAQSEQQEGKKDVATEKDEGLDKETLEKMLAEMKEKDVSDESIAACKRLCEAASGASSGEDEPEEGEKKKDVKDDDDQEEAHKKATDAAIGVALSRERARMRAAEEARRLVRPLVGDVLGMDSADDIMRYALQQKNIATKGVNTAGLAALVAMKLGGMCFQQPRLQAHDSASRGFTVPRQL